MPEERWIASESWHADPDGKLPVTGHLCAYRYEGSDKWGYKIFICPKNWDAPAGAEEGPLPNSCLIAKSVAAFPSEIDAKRSALAEWRRIQSGERNP